MIRLRGLASDTSSCPWRENTPSPATSRTFSIAAASPPSSACLSSRSARPAGAALHQLSPRRPVQRRRGRSGPAGAAGRDEGGHAALPLCPHPLLPRHMLVLRLQHRRGHPRPATDRCDSTPIWRSRKSGSAMRSRGGWLAAAACLIWRRRRCRPRLRRAPSPFAGRRRPSIARRSGSPCRAVPAMSCCVTPIAKGAAGQARRSGTDKASSTIACCVASASQGKTNQRLSVSRSMLSAQ